jgi:Flp pilus assembly pilin Flp
MRSKQGGAALEYILVSTFAAVVGIAALTFIGKVVQSQLTNLADRLGMSETPDLTIPFGDVP